MLPAPGCVLPEPCCTSIADIAEFLLAEAYDAVSRCLPDDCDPLQAYLTVGSGDDGIVDAVTVSYNDINRLGSTKGTVAMHRVTFDVRLRESGWPVVKVEGSVIEMPDPVRQNELARHVFAHSEAMYRRLAFLVRNGLARCGTAVGCRNAEIGRLNPLSPQAGVVGCSVSITVDVPWG
jgi:hypothetical protein